MITGDAKGFTLVEMLLSIAIIGILTALSLPVFVAYQTRNQVAIQSTEVAAMLRRAQTYARAGNGDSQWGIDVRSGVVTLFKGSAYATRDTNFDEVSIIPGSISHAGLNSVVFTKLTGAPNVSGSMTLASNANDIRTIEINTEGMVSY